MILLSWKESENADARAQRARENLAGRADDEHRHNRQRAADNAHGEVVDEHFKPGGYVSLHGLVKLLDSVAAERTHNHGADKHGDSRADDNAQRGDCARDGALLVGYHLAARVANQDGQKVAQHRADHGRNAFIREPAVRNKQRGDKSPCDKRADVRHDHSAEETAKGLYSFFHFFTFLLLVFF